MFRYYLLVLVGASACLATEAPVVTEVSSVGATALPNTPTPVSMLATPTEPWPTSTVTPVPVTVTPSPSPTPPPTAITTPAPLSNAALSFADDFNGTELNKQKWVTIQGTGQIEVDNGAVQLFSSGETFPLVYARENLFPTSGNFTVNVSMRYLSVTERGVGFRLGSTSVDYGPNQNLERDELAEERIIEIWQDSTNWHISGFHGHRH